MTKVFSWVTKERKIDFMKGRKIGYALSGLAMLMAAYSIVFNGFNYGIDFSGGILVEIKSENPINLDAVREQLSNVEIEDVTLQAIGETGTEVEIRAQAKDLDEKEQMQAIQRIRSELGTSYEYRKVELVGPQVGDELKRDGILAALFAILGISLYVWFRFEWQFAIGTLLGLIHDVFITVGLLSLLNFDFNLTTIAAILTMAGFSVNDTVVTYDRIRENLKKHKKMKQYDLLNKSINDIFSRTILTGITTLFASSALFAFGGDTLRSFSFTLVAGIIIGTYSSIYVSAFFLNFFDMKDAFEEKDVNPFGKKD